MFSMMRVVLAALMSVWIGGVALAGGLAVLFVSVLRERLAVCRSDPYSTRVKR